MKRKIFWSMCLMALFSMAAGVLVTTWLFCRDLQSQMKKEVATEVRYLSAAVESSGAEYLKHLSSRGDGGSVNRITWIGTDGTVLYDSFADSKSLENHSSRPEIAAALKTGVGESLRSSDTLAEQTYYYASRLDDGTVLRVASTTRSGLAVMAGTVPWMVFMAAVIFGVTMAAAKAQTQRIVEPINQLDLDAPRAENVYDELSPLVRRLEKQKETIREQMETLREKQEEFTAITENMKEGFIVVDSRADVVTYNSSAVQILGMDISGQEAPVNVISLNRSSSFRQVVDEALNGRHSEQQLDLNGRHYQIIANPVVETKDRGGAVVVILDVTEQHNREELRREFTANVSHELKTPLTSISGYAEIMKNGLVQSGDMVRFADKIYTEAQRLIMLVGDILRLSQLDEGKAETETAAVDLYQAAASVVNRLTDVAKRAKVAIDLAGTPAVVRGSARILDEMIFNLCDNAIKYNRPGGQVHVTVQAVGGHPVLSVADTGIGIPEKDKERIFERFYRVDKSRSKSSGGTGLGLSIVKHGAMFHKAKVELKSKLGEGTEVQIIF
ncbi:MAG: ATP-binding protein [Eubacteriales bacterium]|nr:ATP-binding protein [Eubacteriales bacterium]